MREQQLIMTYFSTQFHRRIADNGRCRARKGRNRRIKEEQLIEMRYYLSLILRPKIVQFLFMVCASVTSKYSLFSRWIWWCWSLFILSPSFIRLFQFIILRYTVEKFVCSLANFPFTLIDPPGPTIQFTRSYGHLLQISDGDLLVNAIKLLQWHEKFAGLWEW